MSKLTWKVHRSLSRDAAKDWNRPIRLLWIDRRPSYRRCKEDFDLFSPYLGDGAVVALHDSRNTFEGPIRVVVKEILSSDRFGPTRFVHSIGWGPFRPADGARFRKQRSKLQRRASLLLPFARDSSATGLRSVAYRLIRSRIPNEYFFLAVDDAPVVLRI